VQWIPTSTTLHHGFGELYKEKMKEIPQIAIIDPNTLAALGLKNILENMMPKVTVCTFGSFAELIADTPDYFFHYFVATQIVLEHTQFFFERLHKTIVLTMSVSVGTQLQRFHTLCVNQPEAILIKALLHLEQSAHSHGRNFPSVITPENTDEILSPREIEVLQLIVCGLLNKEIANRLNISLSTVITHRKNIIEKLGMKSVGALTIYAVMNGYVDVDRV
jgi:DNA-binding CsgD family transcriptional regulator